MAEYSIKHGLPLEVRKVSVFALRSQPERLQGIHRPTDRSKGTAMGVRSSLRQEIHRTAEFIKT